MTVTRMEMQSVWMHLKIAPDQLLVVQNEILILNLIHYQNFLNWMQPCGAGEYLNHSGLEMVGGCQVVNLSNQLPLCFWMQQLHLLMAWPDEGGGM